MKSNNLKWYSNFIEDVKTKDLYETENISFEVDQDGRLLANSRSTTDNIWWVTKGFTSYMKDFGDFKVETLAK